MNDTKITKAFAPHRAKSDGSHASDISRARDTAHAFADGLDLAPGSGMADDLVLVVSELVTNALRHGGGRYSLEMFANPHAVTVAVSDPSPTRPRERAPDLNGGSGGFGWHMVRRIACTVWITSGPAPGKTVHALFAR
ncbi:ATP-binding protein [Streptomyces sp. 21So2-11]|uniref:ATP-binding protein n=1 Tax=Streptomyces sp. 21So2-11 TaxID=3144408 RepID=UPI00321A8D28